MRRSEDVGYSEKRQEKRMRPLYYLRVYEASDGAVLGHVANLSSRGLMLLSLSSFEPGGDQRLRIRLPAVACEREEVVLETHTCWSEKDKKSGFYKSGFSVSSPKGPLRRDMAWLMNKLSKASAKGHL